MTSLTCYTCSTGTTKPEDRSILEWIIDNKGQGYYICNVCNPEHNTDPYEEGCDYACVNCKCLVSAVADHDYPCAICEKVVCTECVINLDFDADRTFQLCSTACYDNKKKELSSQK